MLMLGRSGTMALVVLGAALAGCFGGSDGDDKGDTDLPATPPGLPLHLEKWGCEVHLGIAALPFDDERGAAYPSGYEPLLIPEDGPLIGVTTAVFDCANGTLDGTPIGPSRVAAWGTGVIPPDEHYNEMAGIEHAINRLWSTDPSEADALASWGFGGLGDVTLAATGTPGTAQVVQFEGHGGPGTVATRVTSGAMVEETGSGMERWFAMVHRDVVGYFDVNYSKVWSISRAPTPVCVEPDTIPCAAFTSSAQVEVSGEPLFEARGGGIGLFIRGPSDEPTVVLDYVRIAEVNDGGQDSAEAERPAR